MDRNSKGERVYWTMPCSDPDGLIGPGVLLVRGPDGLRVCGHGDDPSTSVEFRARCSPFPSVDGDVMYVDVEKWSCDDGPPEPPDIKQIHDADGALAALVLEARGLIGPDIPNRVPAIMLGEGYELGWLPVPGVLVLYLPPGVETRDIEAGHQMIRDLTDALANKGTA